MMELGLALFATDACWPVHEVARAAEERGFCSLFVPEHTHIPVSAAGASPTGEGPLDEAYAHITDPLVSLAAAAVVTSSIRLGTAVSLPAEHDPISYAKAVATLDQLSGGRLVLGVGFGWNIPELADHGVASGDRWDVTGEAMELCNRLWRDQVAEFEGTFYSLSPSWSWPKPVQRPRPVTLVGGEGGPRLFSHIARWADGWIPFGATGIAERLPALRAAFERTSRDPGSVRVLPMGVLPTPGKLDHLRSLGITECALRLPSGPRDAILRSLDTLAVHLPNY